MGKGIFITGTDTGVGKTVVAAALMLGLRGRGVDAGYMKPVATGCVVEDGRLLSPDVRFVGGVCSLDDADLVNPVALAPPTDPLSASRAAGGEVDLLPVMEAFAELSGRREVLVVEGIGGVAVPIKRGFDVCDLIARMGLPAVVVMRASLGTINHAVLTVDYAGRKGVDVLGLVVNSPAAAGGSPAERSGPELVREITGLPIIAGMEYDPGMARNAAGALGPPGARLAEWALGALKI